MKFSKLMLGTVQFGMNYGIANHAGKPSFDRVKSILHLAADSGITALDTAAAYGDSECVLGKALTELGIQDKMQVVSKIPPVPENCDIPVFLEESIRRSLSNLHMEVIPVMLFHRESDRRFLPELETMRKKGLILHAGVSLDSQVPSACEDDPGHVQVPCNVFDHRFNSYIARRKGQTFIRSVYLQGMLLMPEPDILPELRPWRRKLESFGIPMKELCMRYLFSLPGNNSVLTGVDSEEQLRENIRLASLGALPPDLYEALCKAVPELPERLIRPSLWQKRT